MENSNKAWFERWFDSPYYHILYRHRDQQEADAFLSNLVTHTHMSGERAWDMACGKGRHAIYLSSLGVEVIGSDISEQSIIDASKKSSPNLTFYIHDMRMPIRVNYFDVVLNLFTSFGYFRSDRENEMVLTSASKALKPGGIFILDYLNCHKVISGMKPLERKTVDDIDFTIEKELKNGNTIIKSISFEADGARHLYHEEVKLYKKEQIEAMLGLRVREVFGSYDLKPYDPETSERLIIIAEK